MKISQPEEGWACFWTLVRCIHYLLSDLRSHTPHEKFLASIIDNRLSTIDHQSSTICRGDLPAARIFANKQASIVLITKCIHIKYCNLISHKNIKINLYLYDSVHLRATMYKTYKLI